MNRQITLSIPFNKWLYFLGTMLTIIQLANYFVLIDQLIQNRPKVSINKKTADR